eukprot:scaffold89319_cov63-Attheya_sp.AAC.1
MATGRQLDYACASAVDYIQNTTGTMSNPVRLIAGNQIGSGRKLPSPLQCPAISLTGLLII